MVEGVVERTPDFQANFLCECEVLLQVDIEVDISWVRERIRAEHSECSNGILSEGCRFEPMSNPICPRRVVCVVASNNVRSILSNSCQRIVISRQQCERST